MKMGFGWADYILRVDLTREKVVKQPFPIDLGRKFVGGAGINAKILYDEVDPTIDTYDPENRLIIGTGPLVGTLMPSANRITFTSKGPFSIFCDSNCGGHFSPELKFAGYEHIVIRGRAKHPAYLWIDDDDVEIRDARHLYGKDVLETDQIIKEELGDAEIHTAIIGVAGENLVRYAIPVLDLWRAPGWGGHGSIMGSKNLKAIAVRGTKSLKAANPREELEAICEKIRKKIVNSGRYVYYRNVGRTVITEILQMGGASGVKNFQESLVPEKEFENIMSERIRDEVYSDQSRKGCFNCPVHCTHQFLVKDGPYAGTFGEKIEYTHVADVKLLGIYDAKFCAKWTFETNRLGIDTSGPQNAIAWAMECYEKGILTDKDTEGLEVTFGNQEVALELLDMIAHRRGKLGDLLADGSYLAARKLGRGSEKYSMTIKGARLIQDLRCGYGLLLAHSVASRGSDHLKGQPCIELYPYDDEQKYKIGEKLFGHPKAAYADLPEGKGYLVRWYEDFSAIVDCLGVCKSLTNFTELSLPGYEDFAPALSLITGIKFTVNDLKRIGERVVAVQKAFNAKGGLTRKDDLPPERWFNEPSTARATRIKLVDRPAVDKMLDEYYTVRGYDVNTGHPTKEKLVELGLPEIAENLYGKKD
jgi:aldehyde:ferredoxin oxidoreductase